MRLWPIMTLIHDTEGISVTTMQSRLQTDLNLTIPRREVREALTKLVKVGVLQSRPRGGQQGGRRLYARRFESR